MRFILLLLGVCILSDGVAAQGCQPGTNPALAFDGNDDRCQVPHDPALDGFGDFCVELWFNGPAIGGWDTLVQKLTSGSGTFLDDAWSLGVQNGLPVAELCSGTTYSMILGGAALADGSWHHYALTRTGTTVRLYLDGFLDNLVQHAGPLNQTTVPVSIGSFLGANGLTGGYLTGMLDEIRVWNVGRTQAEIVGAMTTALAGTEAGLVAYWRLDEGAGQTIFDAALPANDGTVGPSASVEPGDPTWIAMGAPITCAVPTLALGAPPSIGTTVPVVLTSPATPGAAFVVAYATGTATGIPLPDGRTIPLDFDVLLQFSLLPGNGIFLNSFGTLDATGVPFATPQIAIPSAPVIVGATIFGGFVTADPASLSGIGAISPALPITFVP